MKKSFLTFAVIAMVLTFTSCKETPAETQEAEVEVMETPAETIEAVETPAEEVVDTTATMAEDNVDTTSVE